MQPASTAFALFVNLKLVSFKVTTTIMSKPLISRSRRVGNLLFLAGMGGKGENAGVQARDIFEKIKATLEEHGSSLDHVVAATVYLADINDRPKYFNDVWREYFPDNPPTRTCIEVGFAGDLLVEVTCTAEIPE
jgi:2-iminobutanoate/2-iminopropanoate deaminase